jgi:alpha-D-xyloside xylohydrolase
MIVPTPAWRSLPSLFCVAAALAVLPGAPGWGAETPVFRVAGGRLTIEVCADDIIRLVFSPEGEFLARPSLMAAPRRCGAARWQMTREAGAATITTAKLKVRVDLATGAVSFRDLAGRSILDERPGGRTLTGATVMGEKTFHVRQQWEPHADETLHGLGQHQQELIDIKDHDLELRQWNTEISVPLLVSSRGYGLLWDNNSYTRFGDLAPAVPLPGTTGLYSTAAGAQPGDVAFDAKLQAAWHGFVTPPASGDYVFQTYSAGGIKLRVGDQTVVDHWRQGWLPGEDVARVRLTAGKPVPVELTWSGDIGVKIVRLLWKPPVVGRTTSLWSEVGDGVDYTFIYGPEIDRVIAGYRQLTGEAPMMPRWAFGLWQCRERYRTQKESIEVLDGFRRRGIPVDVIVQDWQYWRPAAWGSHEFDPTRFPNPAAWIAEIHQRLHAELMISVWPKFYPGTSTFAALDAGGFLYRPNLVEKKKDWVGKVFTYYDAFNPAARQLYWAQIRDALLSKGVDAWWMDASEPEIVEGPYPSVAAQIATTQTHMNPTAAGTGARVLNAYALENSQAVYEGQRAAAPNRRVFILTRNGFAGQQRYATASWSGDISSTWSAMRKQVPAGLGFAISGVPYWTLDSGGFAVPARFAHAARGSADLDEWRELGPRWFQYATFLPILRVHGQAPKREMWEYGGESSPAYKAQLRFDRLRYRLLPYVYSLAGAVTQQAGTIMRPLVMDFAGDARARTVGDQFMFGPALLISPVTAYKARSRRVYLPPARGGWYDFWTGAPVAPGAVDAAAPYDAIPVHVRAGSIVPFGPELQYTAEKPADPITVVVYAGTDGAFTIYEDDGISYDYEKGAFARIPLRWNDATATLTIGKREGAFPGILVRRTFEVVLVRPGRAVPFSFAPKADKIVSYTGDALDVRLGDHG